MAKGFRLGVFDTSPARPGLTTGEIAAFAAAGIWALGSLLYLGTASPADVGAGDPLRRLMALFVVLSPAVFVWIGVTVARTARAQRDDSQRLRSALDQLRQAEILRSQAAVRVPIPLSPNGTRTAQTSRQTIAKMPATETEIQPALDLESPTEATIDELDRDIFLRALNFPVTAEDAEGFEALRKAMKHRSAARILQAAQDILTLLSQDGIYVDDLIPDRARPEIWRRFAEGERGGAISELGGVRDRSTLALTARRMREEPIFRDTAHHFMRTFDQTLVQFAENATDAEIARLSETRTARAFMIVGRVAGLFA